MEQNNAQAVASSKKGVIGLLLGLLSIFIGILPFMPLLLLSLFIIFAITGLDSYTIHWPSINFESINLMSFVRNEAQGWFLFLTLGIFAIISAISGLIISNKGKKEIPPAKFAKAAFRINLIFLIIVAISVGVYLWVLSVGFH